jgi:GrpB-like predicted nucleotidyltransferase (UPF0157 family)
LSDGAVTLVSYDPTWERRFEEEQAAIRRALGDAELPVEHVGSTAVPGLAATPTIAILVGSTEAPEALAERLASLGYEFKKHYEKAHPFFAKPGFSVHVAEPGTDEWRGYLAFRNHLRANPADVRAYEALKRECVWEHRGDRSEYGAAKASFIRDVLQRAGHRPSTKPSP